MAGTHPAPANLTATTALAGRDLSFDVKVLVGQPPAEGAASSVFVDIIGRPITPVSLAWADGACGDAAPFTDGTETD